MNFRQRIAWVLVTIFLAATCGMVYYIFEISDRFSVYALEHVRSYHPERSRTVAGRSVISVEVNSNPRATNEGILFSLGHHLMDIPLAVWLLFLVLPYLQIFCLLLACTKAEPRFSPAYLWPLLLYLKCRTLYHRWNHPVYKSFNSPVANGHGGHAMLIDT